MNCPPRVETYEYFTNTNPDSDGNIYSGEIITNESASVTVVTVYEEANGGLISREIDNAQLNYDNTVVGGLITTTTTLNSGPGNATVATTYPDGTSTVDTYTGDLLASENQLGTDGTTVITSQTFGYDALNRNTSSTDPVFGTTTWALRADGSVSSSTLPGHNAATVNTQDVTTGTPKDVTRPDGGTQTQSVNLLGQITSQSGAGITPAKFGYDGGTGQLNDLKLYPSGTTGNTTGMQETKWGYDAVTGAMTSQTLADSTTDHPDVLNYTYTGVHLASSSGQGVATTFGYNSAGEQTGSTSNDTSTTVMNKVTAQDDQGNPTAIVGDTTDDITGKVTASATDTFTYASGKLTSENQQAVGVTVHYDYYAKNATGDGASPDAIKDMKLMQGNTVISETDYLYDPNTGRLQTLITNGTAYTVNYLANSNVIQSVGTTAVSNTWSYDTSGSSTGDLASVTTTAGNATLYGVNYTYNSNDQRQTETSAQLNADGTITPKDDTYGYDTKDQLTGVTDNTDEGQNYSYSYDSIGNRTGEFGVANSLNQYSNFTYNARGDETDDATYTYVWDASDHLTGVIAKDNSIKVTFAYDGQGRLIEKDDYYYEGGDWTLSSTRKYVYDGSNIVAELDGNNALVTSYGWGPNGLMSCTDYTSGSSSPTTYLVMQDGNGNVTGLADAATGAVAATYTYDPYGRQLTATGAAAGVCNLRFAQGLTVSEVEVNLFKNRFESWKGMWLSQDPAGIAGGDNLYVYCKDNPVNLTDESGLAPTPYVPTIPRCISCHNPAYMYEGAAITDLPESYQMSIMMWTNTFTASAAQIAVNEMRRSDEFVLSRVQGAGRVLGGTAVAVPSVGACATPAAPVGVVGVGWSVDQVYTGLKEIVSGRYQTSKGGQLIQHYAGNGFGGQAATIVYDVGPAIVVPRLPTSPKIVLPPYVLIDDTIYAPQLAHRIPIISSSLYPASFSDLATPSGLRPNFFGLQAIAENPGNLAMWNDAMTSAWNSSRPNAYQTLLNAVGQGQTPTTKMLNDAFKVVDRYYLKAARAAGNQVHSVHHWNFSRATFPNQVFDPRNLVPVPSGGLHNALHAATSSNPTNIFDGPTGAAHRIQIPDVSTPLPDGQ